ALADPELILAATSRPEILVGRSRPEIPPGTEDSTPMQSRLWWPRPISLIGVLGLHVNLVLAPTILGPWVTFPGEAASAPMMAERIRAAFTAREWHGAAGKGRR